MSLSEGRASVDFDAIHKLPCDWRYFNISILWIVYYPLVIRAFYHLRIRHEVVTSLSIASGLFAAWLIVQAQSFSDFALAALLVHSKDVFDACDGALARITGTGHRLGRFLDTIGDGIVFTVWIAACAISGWMEGMSALIALVWAGTTWLSLFLQCSYFNFHQLHYVRLSDVELTSRLNEREEPAQGAVGLLAGLYDLWFGWQDRLIATVDRWLRVRTGRPVDAIDAANDDWYGSRSFMVANSALCFGTHAFVLIVCLLFRSPFAFLPVVTAGLNLYWLAIVLSRVVVFRRIG